ncbi:AraC family transcriptional regulator [Chroococcidiopsis sp. CCNUC1]|uniref:AraC family transcriptional regulator n=1 Tax=Chroococcidiopsis sp. CCNUC1 TaxID=2653189 RepID=UPI00201FD71F|nr:AraC family transcriptional regulator [Chroococcidiopsis sp. CCNUC1]URD49742.1 AraC family transcriptional regulator [Chroococcidiopsis sp. CCNUC1]
MSRENTTKSKRFLDIVPHSPILSSQATGLDLIRVEHHYQPANGLSECCLPQHLISIHLGHPIQLERTAEGQCISECLIQGDIMITPPYLYRKLAWDRDADFLLLRLDSKLFVSAFYESANIEIIPQFKLHDPLIQQIGLALKSELELEGLSDRLYAESMANALVVHLLKHYSVRKYKVRNCAGGLSKLKIKQVIDYIHDNLEQNLTLVEIAAVIQISPYHFARLFKQSIGITPHQYVISKRIEKAKQLLEEHNSIVLVAEKVGFQSQSHFTKMFRKYTGITPQAYKKLL